MVGIIGDDILHENSIFVLKRRYENVLSERRIIENVTRAKVMIQ